MAEFKLDPVLEHRKRTEDELQKELAEIHRRLSEEQARLKGYLDRKTQLTHELQDAQTQGITISQTLLYQHYLESLKNDVEHQEQRVGVVQNEHTQKQTELLEAMKKRKTLERLKEKNQLERMRRHNTQAQKFMDDVAQTRFNRRRLNPGTDSKADQDTGNNG